MDKPLIGPDILQLDEMDVAPEDVVFHRFYLNKKNSSKKPKKKKKKGAEEEAAEYLIGDGGMDESDNEEIDAIMDSTNPALDSEGDYDYDNLDQVADEDINDLVGDDTSDEELSIGDSEDNSDDEEDDVLRLNQRKGKAREKTGASPFASLEDYEHLLHDKDSKKRKKSKRE